ncbi:type VI secretion system Vgr family protein [Acinetobacter junii]|uniref:type VI secretion system Vgr family protein n=2 Tax=Acinetobacter junii TaxID=40215 RepID=UPI00124DB551|nr:type VI secretion system Vgr family protein [Acinetobacter junii]USR73315.1 type VI secretion system tip protein VgrG [Acinetobacter junii]WRL35118.1 type VI secretion system Vgr family protein [Acinetobacter junii]
MLFNISNVLEKIGLNAQKRAIHVQFSNEELNNQVFLQRIEGKHQLNDGLHAELICLSTNPHIALKQFIGVQLAVDQVTDSGQLFRMTGIVTEACYGQSDGALTLYKLSLNDATNLWHKRRNSRVFMNKTIVEVTEVLFKEWQEKSPLFAASLSLDLNGLKQSYDVRPFVMQHNESDYDFLTRLWRSEGISWLIDEAELFVPHFSIPIQSQKLRLIDDNSQYQALARRSIRHHRSSATEYQDSITGFVAVRSLQPTAVHLQRWQPDALAQDEGAGSVITTHSHSTSFDSVSLGLEQAWHVSPAWMQDLKGEDQATASGNSQLEKQNQILNDRYALQAKFFKAYSSVRDSQVGYWFNLIDHPEINQHDVVDQEFLIISKTFYNQNNLPKDLQQQVRQLLKQSRWHALEDEGAERQANELTLIRRQIKITPEYDPLQHRPIAYPQRAKVVGPEGETIYVDEWGRIKVRFLFTRSDDHGHDGGAGSNDNDTDSAWVDVLTPWAGEGYGARFLPRIGEVVVIDFFDGNIDRPFVTGRIHEAQRSPTKFDVKGQLPDTKKLSGIRSQEVNGSGFNQLRFDDTTGQISTQLQSSHAATQLNLGNLSHPKIQETSSGRGEGFELRTDAWGAVRAGKGMLISTYAQEQAIADHLEAAQAQSLLSQGYESMKMLSEVAAKQQTDALNVINRLPKFIQSLELKTTGQALNSTVNLFKEGINNDPIHALKYCGGFIQDIGALGGDAKGVVDEFNAFFSDAKDAVENLKAFIENVEEHGADIVKGKLASIKDRIHKNPFESIQEVGKVLVNVEIKDFDLMSACGTFSKGSKLEVSPSKALSSLQGFMEGYTQGLESSSDTKQQEQGKIFRQALMLLASPNGIALTTPENIILQASQDIAESASGSINLSAQKNIIGHAQDKISLFAAQKGFRAYAAKGKLELQAQDDAIEAIAKKVIKLISTEDKIEITSPKEIVLTAGGSQLKINADGVFSTTGGKFESKAGQHLFATGAKVSYEVPELPKIGPSAIKFLFTSIFGEAIPEAKVIVFDDLEKHTLWEGVTDKNGLTPLLESEDAKNYSTYLGFDQWSSSFYDDEVDEENSNDTILEPGEHGSQLD